MPHVVAINPSSSAEITAGIQASLDQSAHRWGLTAAAVTSYGGPRVIDSDDDARAAIDPMLAAAGQHRADAYLIGSFTDTGLDELRAVAPVPVIGIAEAALLAAMAHARRVGVISSAPLATFRHELYWAKLGVSGRVVADLAIGRSAFDLTSREAATDVLSAARELVTRRGAQAVILGDPGMGHLRAPLADELGIPVIEPCAAGVAMAAQALSDIPRTVRTATTPAPPAVTPEPTYRESAPSYRRSEPAYREPEPTYREPEPSYREPEPSYRGSQQPSYRDPEPSYREPDPSYREPDPSYREPDPSYREPEPSYRRPEPSYPEADPRYRDPQRPQYGQEPPPRYGEPDPRHGGSGRDQDGGRYGSSSSRAHR